MKLGTRTAMAVVVSAVAASIGGASVANELTEEASAAEPQPTCPETLTPGATAGTFESLPSASTPQRYAPLVFLHPEETLLPMPADCFIAHSSLQFAAGPGKQSTKAELGDLTAESLVRTDYEHDGFTTRDRTRPFAKNRPAALAGRRGFYLDLEDSFRTGAGAGEDTVFFGGTPVYYDYEPARHITYWFFYGFSAPFAKLARQLRRAGFRSVGHEGDWEGISIELDDQDRALSALYFAHGEHVAPVPWTKVKRLENHPIVFSALGSHASYATRQGQASLDITQGGPIWATWLLIADIRVQPWYGYGGAWGLARRVPRGVPSIARRLGKSVDPGDFTGPIGPRFKAPPFATRGKPSKSGPRR